MDPGPCWPLERNSHHTPGAVTGRLIAFLVASTKTKWQTSHALKMHVATLRGPISVVPLGQHPFDVRAREVSLVQPGYNVAVV